jgi:hypothetical protein
MKVSLHDAEAAVASAKATLAEMMARREEAKAALVEIEKKRREGARALLLGKAADTKATRAAANARDDAQKLLEDMELVVDEAQRALVDAESCVLRRRFEEVWQGVLDLGRRRGDLLEKVIANRDAMFAAMTEFLVAGREASTKASQARRFFPYGALGAVPDDVLRYVSADIQKLAGVLTETLPHDIFMQIPKDRSLGRGWADVLNNEHMFWELQELDDEVQAAA